MSGDLYDILGVKRGASEDEIKRAHRRLVKELHPDLHPNDAAKAERFKQVSAAFEILGDAKKRGQYDRGEINAEGQPTHPFGDATGWRQQEGGGFRSSGGFSGMQGDPFEDILSGMFGGARTRRRTGPVKGRDVRYQVEIAFEDTITGARRRMTMADGRTLDVDIPAGISEGQTLRLKSQGRPSPSGGPPGDALLEVRVRPSAQWTREGRDIRMNQPVDLKTAVLGGKVEVPTPSGPVTLKVPAGSNTGSVLRLKGKGVAHKHSPGDLLVRLEIVLANPKDPGLRDYLSG